MAKNAGGFIVLRCAQGQSRTVYTRIFSPLLYQLSYLGWYVAVSIRKIACGQYPGLRTASDGYLRARTWPNRSARVRGTMSNSSKSAGAIVKAADVTGEKTTTHGASKSAAILCR
jgi:hypothetical protein